MKNTTHLEKKSAFALMLNNSNEKQIRLKSNKNIFQQADQKEHNERIKHVGTVSNKYKKRSQTFINSISQNQEDNKYRIVTEMQNKATNKIASEFNPRSKSKSRNQIASMSHLPVFQIKDNRTNQSTSKLKTESSLQCPNCQQYISELNYFKGQLNKIFVGKMLWKAGQINLNDLKRIYDLDKQKKEQQSNLRYKSASNILNEGKKHFYDLMVDIESFSIIDFPKVIQLNMFKLQNMFDNKREPIQIQIKDLFTKLRNHYEGKINANDLEDYQSNQYKNLLIRNLQSRLSNSIRQNLQLKIKNQVLQKSQKISEGAQEYLRDLVSKILKNT